MRCVASVEGDTVSDIDCGCVEGDTVSDIDWVC